MSLLLLGATPAALAAPVCEPHSIADIPWTTPDGVQYTDYEYKAFTFDANPGGPSCGSVPNGTQRGFTGVGTDLTFTFDQPVSRIFVLTQHVQSGDTLATREPSTVSPVGCQGYFQIDFDTPTTTATIFDDDPGGGSGYSVIPAYCVLDEPTPAPDIAIDDGGDGHHQRWRRERPRHRQRHHRHDGPQRAHRPDSGRR